MIADSPRSVPPVSWDHASLSQIREYLNPTESEEDIYRVVDQFGQWVAALCSLLEEHEQHWNTMCGSDAGEAHTAAAAHGAHTRAELAAALDDLRKVQSSLESLAATFVDVRGRVDRLYQESPSAREPMLDWVLARDDEPNEMTRRDNTQWARSLMHQYEQIANEELSGWPTRGSSAAGTPATSEIGTSSTVPIQDGTTFSGDDSPTKPTHSADGQSSTPASGAAGGAAFPGSAGNADDSDIIRRNPSDAGDQLFGTNDDSFPPVIGGGSEFDKDEDDSW